MNNQINFLHRLPSLGLEIIFGCQRSMLSPISHFYGIFILIFFQKGIKHAILQDGDIPVQYSTTKQMAKFGEVCAIIC